MNPFRSLFWVNYGNSLKYGVFIRKSYMDPYTNKKVWSFYNFENYKISHRFVFI